MIFPRIPFMMLRDLSFGSNGERSLDGPVIYVPYNTLDTMTTLPSTAPKSMTIPLLFKRRKNDKSNVYEDVIRPQKVITALRYLLKQSDLWRSIFLDEERLKQLEDS